MCKKRGLATPLSRCLYPDTHYFYKNYSSALPNPKNKYVEMNYSLLELSIYTVRKNA